jgi:hypothetical protein
MTKDAEANHNIDKTEPRICDIKAMIRKAVFQTRLENLQIITVPTNAQFYYFIYITLN